MSAHLLKHVIQRQYGDVLWLKLVCDRIRIIPIAARIGAHVFMAACVWKIQRNLLIIKIVLVAKRKVAVIMVYTFESVERIIGNHSELWCLSVQKNESLTIERVIYHQIIAHYGFFSRAHLMCGVCKNVLPSKSCNYAAFLRWIPFVGCDENSDCAVYAKTPNLLESTTHL